MLILYLRTIWQLLRFEYYVLRGDFSGLYGSVKACAPVSAVGSSAPIDLVCRAVDYVCFWYPKPVQCLQRSAATACLLKRYGFPARLIIGVQQTPFRAHAWVEVQGQVVNDHSYMRETYLVMDCC